MNRLGWTLILIGLGLWGSLFWQAWNETVSTALGQPDEGETDKAKLAKLAGLRDAIRSGDNQAMARELDRFLPKAEDEKAWPKLLRQLADDNAAKRDAALGNLLEAGPAVLGFARRARSMETDLTAKALLDSLEEYLPVKTTTSAVMQIIRQSDIGKDPVTVRGLYWRLVPHTPDFSVEQALARELELDLASPGGQEAAKANLTDADPSRREMAVRLLGGKSREEKSGHGDLWASLAKLAKDPDAAVSLRVRLALMDLGQPPEPVALAERLIDAPAALCRIAESRLLALAADSDVVPAWLDNADSRTASAEAWKAWLAEPGREKLKLKPTEKWDRQMIGQINANHNESVLLELDAGGKTLERLLTNDQIVACGYDGEGHAFLAKSDNDAAEISWPFKRGESKKETVDLRRRVVAVCPWGDGGFLVVRRDGVSTSTPGGKDEKDLISLGKRVISAGALARDGWIALWRDDGTLSWHNAAGDAICEFRLPPPQVVGAGIQALPGRRLLVPLVGENRVVEIDREGREVRSTSIESPLAALRLPDGSTVVATPEGVVKFDPADRPGARQRTDWLPVALSARIAKKN